MSSTETDARISVHALTQDTLQDFISLFECKGAPHYCWCTLWQKKESGASLDKKAAMRARVERGTPSGLLAYQNGHPIAWCAVAPRESYRNLGGDLSKSGVWSLVCFFVLRAYRKRGLATKLLYSAIDYAKTQGARYLEAYPVTADSPSYRFMGIRSMFEDAGFSFVKKAGSRRHVMLLKIDNSKDTRF